MSGKRLLSRVVAHGLTVCICITVGVISASAVDAPVVTVSPDEAIASWSSVEVSQTAVVPTYTITVGGVSNGSVTVSAIKAHASETVVAKAEPATGFSVKTWLINGVAQAGADNTFSFNMPSGNVIVTATFDEAKLDLTDPTKFTWEKNMFRKEDGNRDNFKEPYRFGTRLQYEEFYNSRDDTLYLDTIYTSEEIDLSKYSKVVIEYSNYSGTAPSMCFLAGAFRGSGWVGNSAKGVISGSSGTLIIPLNNTNTTTFGVTFEITGSSPPEGRRYRANVSINKIWLE